MRVLTSNCLLVTHLMQRYCAGSSLKPDQLTDIGVRRMLRPQAVFEAIPEPLLLRCVTRIICFLKRPREVQGMGNYKHTYAASRRCCKNNLKNLSVQHKNNISQLILNAWKNEKLSNSRVRKTSWLLFWASVKLLFLSGVKMYR